MDAELRPLSLGEILDRTFQLYRTHFLLFLGISAIPAGIDLAWKLVQTGIVRAWTAHAPAAAALVTGLSSLVSYVAYVVVTAVAMAAISRAVSAIYLQRPTGIAESYAEVKPHWLRYVWLYVVAMLASWGLTTLVFIGLLVGTFYLRAKGAVGAPAASQAILLGVLALSLLVVVPFGLWMMMRYSLANVACVFEDLGIRASLKRSVFLSKGQRGGIFVMFLLSFVIVLVLFYGALSPVIVMLVKHPGTVSLGSTIYMLVASFITTMLTVPIYGIALTLFYYDARIRKEGFDVEWMMQRAELVAVGDEGVVVEEEWVPLVSVPPPPPPVLPTPSAETDLG